jgi:putative ABC transport system substrate-binding protein
LRLAGFIEGQNLTVLDDGFSAADNEAAAAATAAVKAPADAIVAFGPVRIRAVQMATKTIPLLTISEDLVAEGLASSLARPDRNTTGISLISPDLDGKRGDLLLDAVHNDPDNAVDDKNQKRGYRGRGEEQFDW